MSNNRPTVQSKSPLKDFLTPKNTGDENTDVSNETSSFVNIQTDDQDTEIGDESSPEEKKSEYERATFYVRPEQHTTIEELRIKLRKHNVKTNKSELVREAIDLLANQDIDTVINILANK